MDSQPTPALRHCHTRLNLKKPLLLFAALSGALGPWAKLVAQTATNAYVLDEVVHLNPMEVQAAKGNPFFTPSASSATKTETPLLEVPQTVNVVPRDLFVLQGARSIEDVLLNVAGVSPSVGDGQRDQVYIRGFSAQYDQYLDGVRDEAMYFRDLANIDRIEVIEGPSAVLYGHGSAGGLVNRISRLPTAAATEDISTTYGSWNQRRAELDAGGPIGPNGLTYRFDAAGENSGGFRDQYFLQRYHVSPSAAWQMAPDTRVLVQFDYLNDLRLDDLGIPALVGPPGSGFPGVAPAVPISSYYGLPNSFDQDYVRTGVTTATVTLDHAFSPSVTLHEVFRAEHYTLDRNNVLPTSVYLPAGGVYNGNLNAVWVKRSQRQILRFENDLFSQTETTWKTAAAGVDHNFLIGLEVGRQSAGSNSTQYNAPAVALVDPVLTPVPAGAAPASVSSTAVRADTAGLYLQDQMTFSTHWKALAGVRLDYYKVSQQSRLSPFTQIGSLSHTVSPRIGIVYEPIHNFSIYGTVSQSFSPAAGDGLSTAANTAALKPLKATNYEIGAKRILFDDSLSATVSLFQVTRNITETNPVTNLTTASGKQRSRGIDFALAGRLTTRWSVSASYELLDPTIINGGLDSGGILLNGKMPALVPRNSASLYSTFDLGRGFGIGGGAVYMGGRFTSNDDSVSMPAFIVVNAVAYYCHDHWEARLNCNNVLNHHYLITAGEGTDYTGQTVMPGTPINLSASVTWRL
jgi:catecholate siderophore receptor